MDSLLSIGDLARQAGVSVQTLRHYDRLGLLKPSQVRPSGYRFYSTEDQTRLELIRALRGAQFDLQTIGRLLDGTGSAAEALALQLQVLELQERLIRRQRVVLQAVMRTDSTEHSLNRLKRFQSLARLDNLEREDFLARQLSAFSNSGDPAIWQAATQDFPTELDERHLEIWLELADLVTHPDFQAALERQRAGMPGLSLQQVEQSQMHFRNIFAFGKEAAEQGTATEDPEVSQQFVHLLTPLADVADSPLNRGFLSTLSEYVELCTSPTIDRYWQLVAELKGWPYDPTYAQGGEWVLSALRHLRKDFAFQPERP